ncbi:MAG: hypothetical protein M3N10_06495 [Actinomycetota bacterium]|nr:hypothetical protein [Actinomycetota bacterium]
MSGEQDKDYIQKIEGQMQAAQALIESLEEEVMSLRRDLEQASVALKAAQEEVAARGEALEEKESERAAAEEKAREAASIVSELRIQSSNEQLGLTNQHISELARLQDRFQDQLRSEIEAALSVEDRDALKEEYRELEQAAEQRYEERLSALESSYQEAQERLREGEEEHDRRRAVEIEALREESAEQKRKLERRLREQLEQRLQEALRSAAADHEAELEALRKSFADREQELKKDHRAELENQQAEFNTLLAEMEARISESEERHQAKLREIKGLAGNREQELRKTHSARLAEAKAEAERRIESLRGQREADNKALRARHEQDLAQLRARYEERLEEAAERSRLELWTAQEKLEGVKLERTSEAAAYRNRLKELEAARHQERDDEEAPVVLTQEVAAAEDLQQEETVPQETASRLQARVDELEAALSDSERERGALERELEESRKGEAEDAGPEGPAEPGRNGHERTAPEQEAGGLHAADVSARERVRELEVRLQEAREESRRNAEELQKALESLSRLSDPDRRLRSGISAFNASEHPRHVASISKSLGLPKVHAGVDEAAHKPVFTFVWEELAWRRYVAEAAEDPQEPRVYLVGGGDEPEKLDAEEKQAPNARVDARGRIILGVQAR